MYVTYAARAVQDFFFAITTHLARPPKLCTVKVGMKIILNTFRDYQDDLKSNQASCDCCIPDRLAHPKCHWNTSRVLHEQSGTFILALDTSLQHNTPSSFTACNLRAQLDHPNHVKENNKSTTITCDEKKEKKKKKMT